MSMSDFGFGGDRESPGAGVAVDAGTVTSEMISIAACKFVAIMCKLLSFLNLESYWSKENQEKCTIFLHNYCWLVTCHTK